MFPWKKSIGVYASGMLLGVALVLYPAAGDLFMSPDFQQLSTWQFGFLFTPQIILAILSSLSAPALAHRIGMKKVLEIGLVSTLLSMVLFAISQFSLGNQSLAFGILLMGTAFLGLGFGFTITALNPLAYNLLPGKETSMVTGLHVFIGLGTAVAPLFLGYFRQAGIWWVAGVVTAIMLVLIVIWLLPLTYQMSAGDDQKNGPVHKLPIRIWLYALIVFFYGICEGTFGNWGAIFLEKQAGLAASTAAVGLSVFWVFLTLGRVLFTFIALRYKTDWMYRMAPFFVALVFLLFPAVSGKFSGLVAMAAGGLSLSFYFPNSISRATADFPRYAALVSGILVASIQLGTGISSNAIGWLDNYFSLGILFRAVTVIALAMAFLAFWLLIQKDKKTETVRA